MDQMNLKSTLIRLLNSLALDPELSLSRGSNRSGLSTTAAFLRVRERFECLGIDQACCSKVRSVV